MIDGSLLAAVAGHLARVGLGDDCVAALRQQWPAWRFLLCSDDDVPPRLPPAWEGGGFRLYYINGDEHCLALGASGETAIGLVVATVTAD